VPELPEVETVVSGLRPQLTGRRIESVELTLERMVRYPQPKEFVRQLRGLRIGGVQRRGKYIIMPLIRGRGVAPREGRFSANRAFETFRDDTRFVVHLGMTGHLRVWERRDPIPKHTHLRLLLDDTRELRYDDQRQFGRLLLGTQEELQAARAFPRLGPEPVNGDLTEAHFDALIRARKRPVKSALLDQSFLAGVGNIYADEACFRAGIRPSRWTHRLTARERRALYSAIQEVLVNSIDARGTSIINYVDAYGLPGDNQEKLLVYGRAGEPCLKCGSTLQRSRLAGRGTVYCRRCQR
jgi:formamidopyrimidine-DNA glycosylase